MAESYDFLMDGQQARCHDEGHAAGFFHTYNHFQTKGALYPQRKIHVFLPRDYEMSGRRYPVLYMNDGDTTFFKGGLANQSWEVASTLSDLYEKQAISELIVVAIYPVDRNREYTHVPWNGPDCCELEPYTQCVADFIKPFIDRSYRSLPEPGQTMILGSSHGGLAAFYIANRRPEVFGFAGALSPSFWVGLDQAYDFPYVKPSPGSSIKGSQLIVAVHNTLADPRRRPKLYLDWGLVRTGGPHNEYIEERAAARGREMVELLQSEYGYVIGKDLFVYEDPLGEHTEQSWGRHMPLILEYFAERTKE